MHYNEDKNYNSNPNVDIMKIQFIAAPKLIAIFCKRNAITQNIYKPYYT